MLLRIYVCPRFFPCSIFPRSKGPLKSFLAHRPAGAAKQGRTEFMEQILSVLYGASGVAASALYVPQILKYHRDHNARLAISLLAWGGWAAIAAVTVLYALYVAKSDLIAMVAGLNAVAQLTVLVYGAHARLAPGASGRKDARSIVT